MILSRRLSLCSMGLAVLGGFVPVFAAGPELVHARDGSGVYGYRDTPVQPWSGYRVHDPDRPLPPRVRVGPATERPSAPPSDAAVLFDGKDLSKWQPSKWKVVDGCIEAGEGGVVSNESFGNCQIHVEWMAPVGFKGPWYNQGNSGVNLMGLYEIQIFDSWNEKIYPDGMAGAIYGQTAPLVNPCRPPGEWQVYDIMFTAPVWEGEKLISPARVTLLYNGVLVLLNEEIHGEVVHRGLPVYTQRISKGPLMFGGHNCPVRFRNIWVRPTTAPGRGGGAAAEEKVEKTAFDVVLKAGGDKKIQVIKVVRAHTDLGLKEAKDLVDGAPKPVKEGVTKEEAEKIKKELEESGAVVEIK